MNESYIKNIEKKLLDIGKRNQLINFKDRLSSTVEFYYDDFYDLFDDLKEGKKFQIAKLFENLDETITTSLILDEEDNDPYNVKETVTNAQGLMIERKDKYDFDEIRIIKERFKAKHNIDYLYPLSLYSVSTHALNLMKRKAKLYKEENGVEALYMCFGLFKYRENNEEYFAPGALIPVKITKNYKDEYFIEALDDDFLINQNFIQYIKLTYNVTLPEKADDLFSYLDSIATLLEPINITLEKRINLGIFSFAKIVMYNDIKDNEDVVKNSKLVKLFSLNGTLDKNDDKSLKPYLVCESDSSQTNAILKALRGDSFVLEGPPGTGKSQTITNMISSLIGNNKKVLFVCEKQSALDIVYKNLKKCGLDIFALPIYDNNTNKKDVINNIYSNISNKDKISKTLSEQGKKILKDYSQTEEFFNKYDLLLNQKTKNDKTIYDIVLDSLSFEKFTDFTFDDILLVSKDKYEDILDSISVLDTTLNNLNYEPRNHPFKGFLLTKITKKDSNLFYTAINNATRSLDKINKEYVNLDEALHPESAFKLEDYVLLLSFLDNKYNLKKQDFTLFNLEKLKDDLLKVEKLYKKTKKYKDYFSSKYNTDELLKLPIEEDLNLLLTKYNNPLKRIVGFSKILNKYNSTLIEGKLDYDSLVNDLKEILEFNKINDSICVLDASLKTNFPKYYFNSKTDFSLLKEKIEYLIEFNKLMDNIGILRKNDIINVILKSDNSYQDAYRRIKKYYEEFIPNFNIISNYFSKESLDISLLDLAVKFKNISIDADSMNSYIEFMKETKNIDQNIKNLLFSDNDLSNFKKKFISSFNYLYLAEFTKKHDEFDLYTTNKFETFLSNFETLNKQLFEVSKINIADNITNTWPSNKGVSQNNLEITILREEQQKKRKLLPLRTVFKETAHLIQLLKPVIIMSPLSVSQYLANDKFHFDTVIFDEASQITEENAIGSIYRADQMIVVGDKEQLAPTSFFDSSLEDEDDNYLVYESVLDKANSLLDNVTLKWHYRSKYESLINFSNKEIYKDLFTFPSAEKDNENGLQYVHVDGTYIPNVCVNLEEAKKVVETLFYLLRHTENKSIGIVTFNMSQENLIYKMIEQVRKKDRAYESFFSEEKEEPFFVKNLETVQGDERDIIILSTTFGPNEAGKQSSNFGPLIKEGGYKRLNVAITRAKERLMVISSIKTEDIKLSALTNRGISMLVNFLNYARYKEEYNKKIEENDKYLEYIKNRFESYNLDISTKLGDNKFKIDLVINENDKALGAIILCNGKNIFNSTNDLYFNIKNVLTRRGFKVFYIFLSPDFNQINMQVDNIVKSLGKNEIKISETNDNLTELKEEETIDVKHLFPVFPNVISIFEEEKELCNNSYDALLNIINKISPFKESEFIKLVHTYFGYNEIETSNLLKQLKNDKKIFIVVKFILTKKDILNPKFRRFDSLNEYNRSIDEVYIEELEQGFLEVINFVKTTNKQILFTTFNTLLGYASQSKVTYDVFTRAISNLSDKGEIEINDNIIESV